ncbi:MAG: hypothetical protein HXY34_10545 [Candidatus Thorarchaeota archaeon]|nr:hypothetical protein [Candidatus Thorarchaeota archaeon]
MQAVEFLVLIPVAVIFLVAVFLLERKHLHASEPKGQFLRNMIEEQLRKDEPHEPFFFSLFERYENAPTGSSRGKIEYDLFKETLSTGDSLAATFDKYLRQWYATNA